MKVGSPKKRVNTWMCPKKEGNEINIFGIKLKWYEPYWMRKWVGNDEIWCSKVQHIEWAFFYLVQNDEIWYAKGHEGNI